MATEGLEDVREQQLSGLQQDEHGFLDALGSEQGFIAEALSRTGQRSNFRDTTPQEQLICGLIGVGRHQGGGINKGNGAHTGGGRLRRVVLIPLRPKGERRRLYDPFSVSQSVLLLLQK